MTMHKLLSKVKYIIKIGMHFFMGKDNDFSSFVYISYTKYKYKVVQYDCETTISVSLFVVLMSSSSSTYNLQSVLCRLFESSTSKLLDLLLFYKLIVNFKFYPFYQHCINLIAAENVEK